jgi:hypothetical protein
MQFGRSDNEKLYEVCLLEIARGSSRSQSVDNSLWKRLWTCRKTDNGMNECKKGG